MVSIQRPGQTRSDPFPTGPHGSSEWLVMFLAVSATVLVAEESIRNRPTRSQNLLGTDRPMCLAPTRHDFRCVADRAQDAVDVRATSRLRLEVTWL